MPYIFLGGAGSGGSGGGDITSISATKVTETAGRVFLTPNQRAQILSNTEELASHSERLAQVENREESADEKVKMDSEGAASYLADLLDDETLKNENGKLIAVKLAGLLASIVELNYLQGVTGNIQQQFNAISNVGNFTGSIATYADLPTIISPKNKDMAIVLSDETHDGASSIYVFSGTEWHYGGGFKAGEIRDFLTNAIDLATETKGVLQKNKYEKQNAADTAFTDTAGNLTATNVQAAVLEVFLFADNAIKAFAGVIGSPVSRSDKLDAIVTKFTQIKASMAQALVNKGVSASTSNTLAELASKINSIAQTSVGGGAESIDLSGIAAAIEAKGGDTVAGVLTVENLTDAIYSIPSNDCSDVVGVPIGATIAEVVEFPDWVITENISTNLEEA